MQELKRCTGHCCRNFTLPASPRELKAAKKFVVDLNKGIKRKYWLDDDKNKRTSYFQEDIIQVEEMVIYRGQSSLDVNGDDVGVKSHYYTCKNLDTQTGDCKAYDTRPRMCSEFPYHKPCPYNACTRVST